MKESSVWKDGTSLKLISGRFELYKMITKTYKKFKTKNFIHWIGFRKSMLEIIL